MILSHFLYYFLLLSPCCFQYRKIRFSNKQEPIKTEMGWLKMKETGHRGKRKKKYNDKNKSVLPKFNFRV